MRGAESREGREIAELLDVAPDKLSGANAKLGRIARNASEPTVRARWNVGRIRSLHVAGIDEVRVASASGLFNATDIARTTSDTVFVRGRCNGTQALDCQAPVPDVGRRTTRAAGSGAGRRNRPAATAGLHPASFATEALSAKAFAENARHSEIIVAVGIDFAASDRSEIGEINGSVVRCGSGIERSVRVGYHRCIGAARSVAGAAGVGGERMRARAPACKTQYQPSHGTNR